MPVAAKARMMPRIRAARSSCTLLVTPPDAHRSRPSGTAMFVEERGQVGHHPVDRQRGAVQGQVGWPVAPCLAWGGIELGVRLASRSTDLVTYL
jgi:hypothetical protein